MYNDLLKLEIEDRPVRIAVIGAGGAMGRGICLQSKLTPGLRLVAATDLTMERAQSGAKLGRGIRGGKIAVTDDTMSIIRHIDFDVMIEASNSIESAARYCIAVLKREKPVILMNSEVDLFLGPLLHHIAEKNGTIITSDQGDQYGVIAEMIDQIEMWGFKIIMAGNIKGFLDRHCTIESKLGEAGKRHLEAHACVAMSDGTKLNIEMALLCNAFNLKPSIPGMIGPRIEKVHDVFDVFDFDQYDQGVVDYILGAQPGGGVFVIGKCEDPTQQFYLNYYKLHGRPPYYLFYRPYHLCHLETPRAIAKAYLYGKKVMEPSFGKVAEVFAYAKRDLKKGMVIERGIGCDEFYGMVDLVEKECPDCKGRRAIAAMLNPTPESSLMGNEIPCDICKGTGKVSNQGVPVALLEGEGEKPTLTRALGKDDPLTWDHAEFPGGHYLLGLYDEQRRM